MNQSIKKMKNLVEELNAYSNSYYNHSVSLVSDQEFDEKWSRLQSMEKKEGFVFSDSPTRKAGYLPSSKKLEKIHHQNPLLSLKKTKDSGEIKELFEGHNLLLMPKYDGLTLKLTYENGEITSGSTRGDGYIGEDVSHNLVAIAGIPKQIPYSDSLSIVGEVFIKAVDFELYQKNVHLMTGETISNSRNLASGSIRLLDPRECMARCLCFSPFLAYGLDGKTRKSDLQLLSKWGFETHFSELSKLDFSSLEQQITLIKEDAQNEGIPIDGVVIQINNKKANEDLGATSHHPNGSIAYKFEDSSYETEIEDILWQVNRRGILFPVAQVSPIEIEGTTVSKASLFNMEFISSNNFTTGSKVLISKRNQIIPYIEENLTPNNPPYTFPDRCPSCGSILTMSDQLCCLNMDCDERILAMFTRFTGKKVLDINGVSEGILRKLLELGFIHEFSDLHELEERQEELVSIPGFGEKQVSNLLQAIEESKKVPLEKAILALDIPLIGRSLSKAIAAFCGGDPCVFEEKMMTPFLFSSIPGLGEEALKNIHEWFLQPENHTLWNELQTILEITVPEAEEIFSEKNSDFFLYGKNVVLTGKFAMGTRGDITGRLLAKGVNVQTSVTKSTDILICGDKVGSVKKSKAVTMGILVEDQSILDGKL